tara:strand:- start:262 stop:501 length:240 start_codon:yes stop_codon:yes gene_type:complete
MNTESFMKRLFIFAVIVIVCMQFNVSSNTTEVPKVEEETFFVIDASYIDHTGKYEDCVEYADSYKDHHEYVVVKELRYN